MTDISPFERIRQISEEGLEYWSARDLAPVLDYSSWERFSAVIKRAETACKNSDQDVEDHFHINVKMVELGSGARRSVEDYLLSRYACYLIIQNADPSKEIVALGQTYFAVQTRRQEQADELAGLSEDKKRILLRRQLSGHNKQLAQAARDAGVIRSNDFAIFQDHGYMGLYGGLHAQDIHARKNLARSQQILDHMGSEELAANLFRATQTEAKLARDGIKGKDNANRTHHDVGQEVRNTIKRLGGTMPEQLPTPKESIAQVQQREKKRLARGPQMDMFADAEAPE